MPPIPFGSLIVKPSEPLVNQPAPPPAVEKLPTSRPPEPPFPFAPPGPEPLPVPLVGSVVAEPFPPYPSFTPP